jgi:CHASE2 domain-containing sensor protein
MSQRVILSLGNGSLLQGFNTVQVQLFTSQGVQVQVGKNSLPAAPELERLLDRWRALYDALNKSLYSPWNDLSESETRSCRIEVAESGETNFSTTDFVQLRSRIIAELNQWLKAESFQKIDRCLRDHHDLNSEMQFLIKTDDQKLQTIPWQEWEFFTNRPNAEVAICPEDCAPPQAITSNRTCLRVLLVLGDSTNIDIEQDKQDWQSYQATGRVELEILNQPTLSELHDFLWDQQGWDIFFFAGHSSSETGGILKLRQNQSITLEQLRHELSHAIRSGLKLAIFNSCQGLELARTLVDREPIIPQVIVMREVVSDAVAHQFLKSLLNEFFRGKPLYPSIRSARERLNNAKNVPPCADWLPILFQNPTVGSLSLPNQEFETRFESTQASQIRWQSVALTSLGIALLTIAIRLSGFLEPLDTWAFDTLQRLKPTERQDQRIVVVRITDQDTPPRYVQAQSLTDKRLSILLRIINSYQPRIIGLDIKRSKPIGIGHRDLVKQLKETNTIAICAKTGDVPPLPTMELANIAMSDILKDNDEVIRRQFLTRTVDVKNLNCQAPDSFSLKIAESYLGSANVVAGQTQFLLGRSAEASSKDFLTFAENGTKTVKGRSCVVRFPSFSDPTRLNACTTLKPLSKSVGGFRNVDHWGEQTLINFRRSTNNQFVRTVTLSAVEGSLTPAELTQLFEDNIVLIGVDAEGAEDYFNTPIQSNTSGVLVHAQMVSQLISAVLDNRPLIWYWDDVQEGIWIFGWAVCSSFLAWRTRSLVRLGIKCMITLVTLSGTCWILFIVLGGWVPLVPAFIVCICSFTSISVLQHRTRDRYASVSPCNADASFNSDSYHSPP